VSLMSRKLVNHKKSFAIVTSLMNNLNKTIKKVLTAKRDDKKNLVFDRKSSFFLSYLTFASTQLQLACHKHHLNEVTLQYLHSHLAIFHISFVIDVLVEN
jgi:hypothetical protein